MEGTLFFKTIEVIKCQAVQTTFLLLKTGNH
jgi:hypothetical protein